MQLCLKLYLADWFAEEIENVLRVPNAVKLLLSACFLPPFFPHYRWQVPETVIEMAAGLRGKYLDKTARKNMNALASVL